MLKERVRKKLLYFVLRTLVPHPCFCHPKLATNAATIHPNGPAPPYPKASLPKAAATQPNPNNNVRKVIK